MSTQDRIAFGGTLRKMMSEEGIPAEALVQELANHPKMGAGVSALIQAGDTPENIVNYLARHYDAYEKERQELVKGLQSEYEYNGENVSDLDSFLKEAGESGMGVLAGSGKWFTDKALGTQQLMTFDDEKETELEAEVAEKRRLEKPLMETTAAKFGELLPEFLATAAVPASGAAGLGARVASSAATNAGLGAGLAAIDPDAAGESTLEKMAWAGGLGGLGGAVGETLVTGLGKYTPKALKEFDDFLKSKGINLTEAELKGDPQTQTAKLLANITGTGENTARRNNRAAVLRALGELRDQTATEGAGASQLYDEFAGLAEGATMPAEATAATAKDFLKTYPEDFRAVLANADMRRAMKLDDALTVPSKVPGAPDGPQIVDEFGNPFVSAPQATDEVSEATLKEVSPYSMFQLRKDVGERTRKAGSTASQGKAKELYGSIKQDMADWGKSSPEAELAMSVLDKADFKQINKVRAGLLDKVLRDKSIRTGANRLERGMEKGGKLAIDPDIRKLGESMRNMDLESPQSTILQRLMAGVILSGGGAYSANNPVAGAVAPLLMLRYANSLRRKGAGAGTKALASLLRTGSRQVQPEQKE